MQNLGYHGKMCLKYVITGEIAPVAGNVYNNGNVFVNVYNNGSGISRYCQRLHL